MAGCSSCGQTATTTETSDTVLPGDNEVYVMRYDNGFTEEVTGINVARQRIWSPETRPDGAKDAGPAAVYTLKNR